MRELDLKAKWRRGEATSGIWMHSTDPTTAEIIGLLQPDWVMIDAEHGALDLETIQTHLMVLESSPSVPLIRVPSDDHVYIKRIFDLGAAGVLIPQIQSAAQARRAVAACKYPPQGVRGAGPRRPSRYGMQETQYLQTANERTIVLLMIEHIDAVQEIDAILAIPGLDGIVFGPLDLSASMDLMPDFRHPEVQEAMGGVARKARTAGIPFGSGRMMDTPEELAAWLGLGAQLLPMGSDQGLMQQGARHALDLFARTTRGAQHG
jgi:2-keto-3-deoxy-L-rhamnonate aldolase RhmA